MASASKIEWTESTWNPIVGCSLVSPGCTNCYAMKMAARLEAMGVPHYAGLTKGSKAGAVWTGKLALAPDKIVTAPLRRRKPTVYFVNSMGDLFHEDAPDEWIDRVFAVMALAEQHTFQVLTKRAARMRQYASEPSVGRRVWKLAAVIATGKDWPHSGLPWPLDNVWLGASCERQAEADARIPELLATPAAVRFISAEPLLGPIDLYNGDPDPRLDGHQATHTFIGDWWEPGDSLQGPSRHGLDWVIVGGESGPDARPMHPDWARSLRDQCAAADVAFFMKQMTGKKPIPSDLLVRQFPTPRGVL